MLIICARGGCSLYEASLRRGSARACDHAELVREQWLHAARCKFHLFIVRVATDDNIGDLPSREVCPLSFACVIDLHSHTGIWHTA